MIDDLSTRLDRAMAVGTHPDAARRPVGIAATAPAVPVRRVPLRERFPWVTAYLAVQFLWGAVLFLPGSQQYRPIVRGLPYVAGVALLLLYLPAGIRSRAPRGTLLLILALGLLVLNLLHPTSQLAAGVAQCVFQGAIAAPMFWGWKAVRNPGQLRRLLWIAFLFNTLGAGLGVLQVYYPDRFMPPQFNTLGIRLNDMYVESLTYVGPNGERIVRPPGLSDQPGGAATSGALTVALGAGLSLGTQSPAAFGATMAAVAVGFAAIYLTQVRSLLLMAVGAMAVLAFVLFRRGEARLAARIGIAAAIGVVGSFLWARSLGGESVEERFIGITRQGAMRTYQDNRGGFVAQTFGELLNEYPFGAGVGRWGMMQVYFGDPEDLASPPIYVEIQITGWLLDGGVLMWVLYGGALGAAMWMAYRFAAQRHAYEFAHLALVVLAVQVLIAGFSWAGPTFNTQLGALFWFLTSALYGAARGAEMDPVRLRRGATTA